MYFLAFVLCLITMLLLMNFWSFKFGMDFTYTCSFWLSRTKCKGKVLDSPEITEKTQNQNIVTFETFFLRSIPE